jgi:hypothetical protein
VQLQQRLIQKEQELEAQQEALSRLVLEQQQRTRDRSEDAAAQQAREMGRMRDEMRRIEAAASSAAATAQAALETSANVSRQNSLQQQHQYQQQQQSQQYATNSSGSAHNNNNNNYAGDGNDYWSRQSSPARRVVPPAPAPGGGSNRGSALNSRSGSAVAGGGGGGDLSPSARAAPGAINLTPEQQQQLLVFYSLPARDKAFRQTVAAVQWLTRRGVVARDSVARLDRSGSDTWTVEVLGTDDGSATPMTLLFSYDEDTRRLYIYSTLLHFLPHDPAHRMALYEALLEGALMGREMAGGGVGVSVKNNLVLMATSVSAAHSDEEAAAAIVGSFVESAQSWSKAAMHILHGSSKTLAM